MASSSRSTLTSRLALIGAVALLVIAIVMGVWGLWVGAFFPSAQEQKVASVLFGGAFIALAGAVVAGVILLVGRARPVDSRAGFRIAALVVVVLAALGGPVNAGVRYAWLGDAEPRFSAALQDLRMPDEYTELAERPLTLGPTFPDGPYAARSWRPPEGFRPCNDLREALRAWLEAPLEPNAAHVNARCGFDSRLDGGSVHGTVIDDEGETFVYVEVDAGAD